MTTALSVNLNKIALLRNSRLGDYPSVLAHGKLALAAGAQGLTVHPRPDQRHIRPQDVHDLAALVRNRPGAEFNIEGNPFAKPLGGYPGLLPLIEQTRPQQCTLVPDSSDQLTSDHGFNLLQDKQRLQPIIAQLKAWGVRVSLFMDPDVEQIKLAERVGADRIELYTGPFAEAFSQSAPNLATLVDSYREAARVATAVGLGVNAGHDLNLENLTLFLQIPDILEVSIGHALTVDALDMGFVRAVQAYTRLCQHS